MPFVPERFAVPAGLETGDFVLEPLTVEHVELDLAALLSSPEMLREWSGTTWPEEGFTLEENRQDLARHHREHREREAFTYTVLSPDRRTCLGCVYITPLAWQAEANRGALDGVVDDEAVVGFWVVERRLADGLDARLLEALRTWLASSWSFSSVAFVAPRAHQRQIDLFSDAGLTLRNEIDVRGRGGRFALFS
jgi:RimJ/RimL family protein N-acetyltransferase